MRERGPARAVRSVLDAQPWDSLAPHLVTAAHPGEAMAHMRQYSVSLVEWNRNVSNLISRNDEARFVSRHLRESIEPLRWLKECGAQRWLDFGSGAGLPAIPLAIGGLGSHWTLVESRRVKTLFILKVLKDIGLIGIDVVQARLEALASGDGLHRDFDGFTSRAVLALGPTLLLAARFVIPGGHAFLWKGSRRDEEMARDKLWSASWDFDGLLGIGDGQTAVARFTRLS